MTRYVSRRSRDNCRLCARASVMAFLFGSNVGIAVPVSIHNESATDEAIINQDIWNSFDKLNQDRLAVSITPSHALLDANQKRKPGASCQLKSITCWTKPSTNVGII